MRTRTGWLALLLTAGFLLAPATVWGQAVMSGGDVPPADPVIPLPLYHDRPERGGFYAAPTFILFRMTNPIKEQAIAIRGVLDFDGSIQSAINIVSGTTTAPVVPGNFFGSGKVALDAQQVSGPSTYQPGFGLTLGWRFGEGSPIEAIEFRWRHLQESKYNAVASLVDPNFKAGNNLENTFLFSPVSNFPNEFAGTPSKIGVSGPITSNSSVASITASVPPGTVVTSVAAANGNPASATLIVGNGNLSLVFFASSTGAIIIPQAAYGIWNGATTMSISFVQRYDDYDLISRIPIYQGEDCRCYGLVGPRHVALWERFGWRTTDVEAIFPSSQASATASSFTLGLPNLPNVSATLPAASIISVQNPNVTAGGPAGSAAGNSAPQDVANYSNIVSNQMWGPMVGVGSEYYWGHGFSTSLDLRAGALLDVVKERASYELGDRSIANKRARTDYTIVPELDACFNVTWYPIEGVEIRVGYELNSYFNTVASQRPVSFNYGALDPPWEKGTFRILDGWTAGIAFIF